LEFFAMSLRFAALALPALICLGALAVPFAARADAAPAEAASPAAPLPPIRPLAGVLYTVGQNQDAKATLTDPSGKVTANVDLTGIIDIYAGAEFPLAPNGLALQLTVGVHESTSDNGVSARRYPLEALLLYPVSPSVRIGGGVRYPAHLRFIGAGDSRSGLTATPSVLGLVEIKMSQHFAVDLRYVKEQYQEDSSAARLDASHFDAGVQAIY
jgi:hypothetical protein